MEGNILGIRRIIMGRAVSGLTSSFFTYNFPGVP
jgi:hypothetical protein